MSGLAPYRCAFAGWILAWASSVVLSAAIKTIQNGQLTDGLVKGGRMIWETGDAVPPAGKLALGGALAVLLLVVRRFAGGSVQRLVLASALAGAAAIAFALGVPAFGYYAPMTWPNVAAHYFAGLAGGLVFALSWLSCTRRAR